MLAVAWPSCFCTALVGRSAAVAVYHRSPHPPKRSLPAAASTLLPVQVDLVHPDRVAITTEEGCRVIRIGGVKYDRADLFHVKAYPWPGQLEGLSPIAYAREAIGLGLGPYGTAPASSPGADLPIGFIESDQEIKQPVADTLRARWKVLARGPERDIAVLGNGARFRPLAIAPEEAQFIATQKLSVSTISRFFGIPPEMMAGETAGHEAYTSPEMCGTDFLTFTLRPWLARVERAVSGLLPSTQTAKFNAGGMVRTTLRDRYEAHKVAIEAGFLTVNEVRELEDRPPLPPSEGAVG